MNTPTLRFKEFSGEWEVKKLGDLFSEKLSNGEMTSKLNFVESNGNFYLIQLNDLYESNIKMLVSKLQMIQFNENAKCVEVGDTMINRVSIKPDGVGKVTIVTSLPTDLKTTFESNMFRVRFSRKLVHQLFFAYFSLSKSYIRQKSALSKTTNQSSLNQSDISSIEIPIPTLPEQTKIANFLTAIDEKIAQLSQTAQLLTDYKKGVMQQIFSQQLRFKDDDGREFAEWEEREIDNDIEFLSGYPFDGEDIKEVKDGIALMRGVNISEGFIRHTNEMDRFYAGNIEPLKKYLLKENDLVIGMDGSKVGKNSALITQKDANTLLVQRVARLRAKPNASIAFIYQHINSSKFHDYVEKVKTSSGIPHISAKHIKEFKILFPSLQEQTKIANFLTAIDDKINHNQTQFDAMKQYKSGLLQQMFV